MKNLLFVALATLGLTTTTTAQSLPNYVPSNGLVGWWPFIGNSNDGSGNGYNGTVNGASLTTDRFGNANSAYTFDGVDDYINAGNNAVFNLNTLSISLWYNENSIPIAGSAHTMISKSTNIVNEIGYRIETLPDGLDYFVLSRIGFPQPGAGFIAGPAMTLSTWTHIVIVKNGSNTTMYKNGVLSGSNGALSALVTNSSNLLFGAVTASSLLAFFDGKLDDIGIWNRALTQQEITDLYNATNCSNNSTINPQINSLSTGSTATFNATTSDPSPSYVWQSDLGQGFQTLNNFGNYSGVNSATLNIANVQISEHNQPIRVITASGNCIDTSNIAIINIADTCIATITDTTFITVTDTLIINTTITSLNPPSNSNTIKVFPNPTNDHITIDYGNFNVMNGYQLKIENSLGQQVFQTSITQQSDYLNLTAWGGNGLYFVHIIDPQGNTIDIRKIVLQ